MHNLLELMLLLSDNSATDLVLKVAGGSPAVNARLGALGISGISVDRPTIQVIADVIGVKDLGAERAWSPAEGGKLSPEPGGATCKVEHIQDVLVATLEDGRLTLEGLEAKERPDSAAPTAGSTAVVSMR